MTKKGRPSVWIGVAVSIGSIPVCSKFIKFGLYFGLGRFLDIASPNGAVEYGICSARPGAVLLAGSSPCAVRLLLEDFVSFFVVVAVAVDEDNDIAALRLDVSFGKAALFADSGEIVRGKFLVCPAGSPKEVKIGIVSADSRFVQRQGGALGVSLRREGLSIGGVEVEAVYERTAAARDGVQSGDVIRSVNGRRVFLVEQLQKAIASHYPGESVELVVQRGDRTLHLKVTLGFRSACFGRFSRNWSLNGNTSTRLSGFD